MEEEEEEDDEEKERERQEKMWMMERITTLSRENEEMKRMMEVMEAKIAQQERMEKEMRERQLMMEAAITQIAQHTQQQNVFNESTKTTLNGLVEEVKKHQDLFQETVRVLQNHEQQVVRSGGQRHRRWRNSSTRSFKKTQRKKCGLER